MPEGSSSDAPVTSPGPRPPKRRFALPRNLEVRFNRTGTVSARGEGSRTSDIAYCPEQRRLLGGARSSTLKLEITVLPDHFRLLLIEPSKLRTRMLSNVKYSSASACSAAGPLATPPRFVP